MLPCDLMNIIEQYNEYGVFMNDEYEIYWFNGKRFEFWCEATNDDLLYIGNDIYKYKNNHTISKWHQQQFKKCEINSIILDCDNILFVYKMVL